MKALLFTNLFPTSAEPTRGVFTRQIAAELAKLCELEIAVPLPWFPRSALARRLFPEHGRRFGQLAPEAGSDGLRVCIPRYPLVPKISESLHAELMGIGVRARIERLHHRIGFDVINAHWLYPDGVVAARLGERLRIPVVLTALGCDANEFLLHPGLRRKILTAIGTAQAVTTVSADLARVLRDAGVPEDKITVIPNGVDAARFAPRDMRAARAHCGLPAEPPLVVCVSRLSEEKGVHFLVEAVAHLRTRLPNILIRVVGEGAERARLQAQAEALGVGDRIAFVGAVPHSEVATWFAAASVVCIPSVREGHPNAAMEALASGRPVVASRVGALPDIIDAHNGLLVAPGDPVSLAEALERALTIQWKPERIADTVRQHSWGDVARRYFAVMQSVVRDRPGRMNPAGLAA